VYVLLGRAVTECRWGGSRILTFMCHAFLLLSVKKWLKSVYIYGSYRKIKNGVSLFWTTDSVGQDANFRKWSAMLFWAAVSLHSLHPSSIEFSKWIWSDAYPIEWRQMWLRRRASSSVNDFGKICMSLKSFLNSSSSSSHNLCACTRWASWEDRERVKLLI